MLSFARARRCGTAFTAALALLLAQAIGLAHAVAHPHAHAFVAVTAAHGDSPNAFDVQHEEGSWQCQLFDQLSHADGLTASPQAWALAEPATALAASPALPVRATCSCGYHARGPPHFLA